MDTNCMTVSRFILEKQKQFPSASGELTTLLTALLTSIKAVGNAVRRAGVFKMYGLAGSSNVTGDDQKKLDVLSNDLFINMLTSSYAVRAMVSEENEDVILVDSSKRGKYMVAFDPLDGSSNIECLASIGSIFGILKTIGEFVLTEPDMKIKPKGKIYSTNEGYYKYLSPGIQKYLTDKKNPETGEPYGARYIGSMVADMHRTIKYGGIFMYPANKKSPKGKLRLLYECNPMAFVVEQAGGAAIDGKGRILDIVPTSIHQRTPIFIGSKDDVAEIKDYIEKYDS